MAIYIDEGIEFYHRIKRSKDFKMSVSHFHDKHELYYLVKGATRYFINNEIFSLTAGDMVFIPKGAFHKTTIEQNKVAERIILVFDDEFAGLDYAGYIQYMITHKHIRFPDHELIKVDDIFSKIEKECIKKEKHYLHILIKIKNDFRLLIHNCAGQKKNKETIG